MQEGIIMTVPITNATAQSITIYSDFTELNNLTLQPGLSIMFTGLVPQGLKPFVRPMIKGGNVSALYVGMVSKDY